jgi:hypothetical protein
VVKWAGMLCKGAVVHHALWMTCCSDLPRTLSIVGFFRVLLFFRVWETLAWKLLLFVVGKSFQTVSSEVLSIRNVL